MKHLFTFLLFHLMLTGTATAQNYNFTIHYPLPVDHVGSGNERQQLVELQNGNIVMYRFEYDSTVMQHQLRYWCIDAMGNQQWNKRMSIGAADSIFLFGSLMTYEDGFVMAYSHVIGEGHSAARVVKCDASGNISEAVQLDVTDATQVRDLRLLLLGQEIVVAGSVINSTGDQSVFYAKTNALENALDLEDLEVFTTTELNTISALYLAGTQELHVVGTRDNVTIDLMYWEPDLNSTGISFPEDMYVTEGIEVNGDRYYSGFTMSTTPPHPLNGTVMKVNANNVSEWHKELELVGQMYHGSYASDLVYSNGKVLIMGYGSVPHPVTYLTEFDEDGTVLQTQHLDSYHTFNYNRGQLFQHSNGHFYTSALGGVFTPDATFTTALVCLNENLENSCEGDLYSYNYLDRTATFDTTNVQWVETGSTMGILVNPFSGTMEETILCHTHLSLSEYDAFDVQLAPNPFTESTELTLPDAFSAANTQVICTDALGRTLDCTVTVSGTNNVHVQLSNTASGLVIFHLKDGAKEATIKGYRLGE